MRKPAIKQSSAKTVITHTMSVTAYLAAASVSPSGEPTTYKAAMRSPNSDQWELGMDDEIASIEKNKVWELVDLPEGRKAIKCKWVYKHKYSGDGALTRYKARLVAKGFTQVQGIDYDETFSPVARLDSIRLLLALAALEDWDIHQIDVKTAFLNGELDEEIYMDQPEGYRIPGQETKVYRLLKALYGLKQASRLWYLRLRETLLDINFEEMLTGDVCIFIYRRQVGDPILTVLIIYVDDITIMGNNLDHINEVKTRIGSDFEITDAGEVSYFLGLRIVRDRTKRTITIDQHKYLNDVLARFQMDQCHPASTPFPPGMDLVKNAEPISDADPDYVRHYQSIVGSLMYAMLATRPDIAFAVTKLSQFGSNPDESHLKAAKHVLHYLAGSKDLVLTYGTDKESSFVGYCDADYAADRDDRRSMTGYVYLLAGAAIAWACRKQPTVATSTVQSEYMALSTAAKHAAWIEILCKQLDFDPGLPIALKCDNKGARDLAVSPKHNKNTKHIDVQYHFIREKVAEGLIAIVGVPSIDNVSDILTKPMPRERHIFLTEKLGLL